MILRAEFRRWIDGGIVRYAVTAFHEDGNRTVLDGIDHDQLVTELGEGIVAQIDARKANKGVIYLAEHLTRPAPHRATSTTKVRMNLSLRPESPSEQAILAAIEGVGKRYGARSALARDLIIQGYLYLKHKINKMNAATEAAEVLDLLALGAHQRTLSKLVEVQRILHGQEGRAGQAQPAAAHETPAPPPMRVDPVRDAAQMPPQREADVPSKVSDRRRSLKALSGF